MPGVEFVDGSLGSVNAALERLKSGDVSGKRLVVRVKKPAVGESDLVTDG